MSSGLGVGTLVDVVGRKLDQKRRLTVSAGWREVMGQPDFIYLAPGITSRKDLATGKEISCIDVLPKQVLDYKLKDLLDLPDDDPDREHIENYCENIAQVYFDVQGRIRIPERYLSYAGIKDKVMMSGANDCIKIWAVEEFEEEKRIDFVAFRSSRIAMAKRSAKS